MVKAISIRNLSIANSSGTNLLDHISFEVNASERVGLIGQSGSGKSLTAATICGLLRPPISVVGGDLSINGREMTSASARIWRATRGRGVFQIFQSPTSSLTPNRRIGPQLMECACLVGAEHKSIVQNALDRVLLPQSVIRQYPYQLSGGMNQRVLIAMALILRPSVLIADEPTTGLDILTESQILDALRDAVLATNAALLFISHDLRAVQKLTNRVIVMQSGKIIEDRSINELKHSTSITTRDLMRATTMSQSQC